MLRLIENTQNNIETKKYNFSSSGLPIFSTLPYAVSDWLDSEPIIDSIYLMSGSDNIELQVSDFIRVREDNNKYQIYTITKEIVEADENCIYHIKINTDNKIYISDSFKMIYKYNILADYINVFLLDADDKKIAIK